MRKNRGQMTILILLLALLGLTAGLSFASRSLSDLRQVTYVDSGTRALAAAEAGLQLGLAPNSPCGPTVTTITGSIPMNGILSVTCIATPTTTNSVTAKGVDTDDVIQVDLSSTNPSLKYFDVSWTGTGAIEIIVLDSPGNIIRRYVYNSAGQTSRNNGFPVAFASDDPDQGCLGTGSYCDHSFGAGTSCTGASAICYKPDCGTGPVSAKTVRIRPIYEGADITLCGRTAGKNEIDFSASYQQIVVKATTTDGTVRKIQANRFPSALPSVFDDVIYSGGNISR